MGMVVVPADLDSAPLQASVVHVLRVQTHYGSGACGECDSVRRASLVQAVELPESQPQADECHEAEAREQKEAGTKRHWWSDLCDGECGKNRSQA
jgi:hypothetical protein